MYAFYLIYSHKHNTKSTKDLYSVTHTASDFPCGLNVGHIMEKRQ